MPGDRPTEEEYWNEVKRGATLRGLAAIQECARQLITITLALPAVYLAGSLLADLRSRVSGLDALPFVLPVLLWIAALALAVLILVPFWRPPEDAESWVQIKERYLAYARSQFWLLLAALACLALGLVALAYALYTYFAAA